MTELRKSLESIQEKHEEEIGTLQGELEEANENKDHFETQYKSLLGRVNTIKTSLGDRLKADAVSVNLSRLDEERWTLTVYIGKDRRIPDPCFGTGRTESRSTGKQHFVD